MLPLCSLLDNLLAHDTMPPKIIFFKKNLHGVKTFIYLCNCLVINIISILFFVMDNAKKINELETLKTMSHEYFVTLDGKPVCPPINDEPGSFDKVVAPLYDAFAAAFPERVHVVRVTTYNPVFEDGE